MFLTFLLIIIGLVILIAFWFINTKNKFVILNNRIDSAWAEIDNVSINRRETIPNLVNIVQGYTKHEKETLTEIVELRNKIQQVPDSAHNDQLHLEDQMTKGLSRVIALSEAYPELKADSTFVRLMSEITAANDKITYARRLYINTIAEFNNAVEMFPSSYIANANGYTKKAQFEARPEERENVEVKF